MSAAHEPSITSEILRLCERDTIPAPAPKDGDKEEEELPPRSSVKELVRASEPQLDTIPAPPPSSANDAEPPTLPSPPKLPTIELASS